MDSAETKRAYLVGGRRLEAGSSGFAEAIAAAHSARERPRCLCLAGGVEMYVARRPGVPGQTGDGYIVKRMPDTGSRHAPDCESYEPPAALSGLGQVLGTAIREDPATGQTTLKLGFSLSKVPGHSGMPPAGGESASVATDGTKLSLRGLLHYLWDQAELTRWQPGFTGKRSWATVRKQLLLAADDKVVRSQALQARLYIPELFSVDNSDAINARRLARWDVAMAAPGKPQQLLLSIAEVKEIVPARYGHRVVVRHVPDQAFVLDAQLYRRLERRFQPELALWGASDSLRMVMIATFGVSGSGVPALWELSLMLTTAQWLPVEDELDRILVERLVHAGRTFRKVLRVDLPANADIPCAVLLDCGAQPWRLQIKRSMTDSSAAPPTIAGEPLSWTWDTSAATMPELPEPRWRMSRERSPHLAPSPHAHT